MKDGFINDRSGGSGAGEMRGSFIRIKNALTIAGPVGEVVKRRDQQSIKR